MLSRIKLWAKGLKRDAHAIYLASRDPRVPWYDLPALYRARRAEFLADNGSYSFAGYGEMFRRYLLRSKSPVPHPFLRRG